MGDLPETLSMFEYPDMGQLKKQIHNNQIYLQDRIRLYKYLQNKTGEKIEVEYARKKFNGVYYGRYFPTQGQQLSATFQWRKIRASLFAQTHDDVDVVNCHPTLLEQLYKRNTRKDTPALTTYINKRAEIIDSCEVKQESIDRYNTTKNDQLTKRDIIKTLFTIIIYGGTLETFERQFEFTPEDYKLPEFFHEFHREVRAIGCELLETHEPYMRQLIVNFREERRQDARDNALLSLILQDIEARVVVCAMNEFKKLTRAEITAYTYDGFMALKTPNIDAICVEVSERVRFLTGYDLKFISKPFSEPLGEPEWRLPKLLDYKSTLTVDDYDDYDNESDPSILEAFITDTFAYIGNGGKSMWALRNYKNGEILFTLINSNALKSTLVDYTLNRKIKKKRITLELSSKIREMKGLIKYKDIDFVPYLQQPPKIDRLFNLFTGFKHAHKLDEPIDMDIIQPALRHLREIWCAGDNVAYEYLINWLAHMIQKPAIKMCAAILIKSSSHGTGKGIMCDFLINHVIGEKYAIAIDDSEQIFNKFNSKLEHKLLTVLDEIADSGAFLASHDKLKSFISRQKLWIEKKGLEGYSLNDFNNIIMISNNMLPIKIETTDRRYLTLEVSNKLANNHSYFRPLATALNENCGAHFFRYLAKKDITDFNPREIPSTKLKDELKMYSLPTPILFLIDIVEGEINRSDLFAAHDPNILRAATSVLYQAFNAWATTRNFKVVSLNGFTREIKKIIEPTRFYIEGTQVRGYMITLEELKNKCIAHTGVTMQ